MSSSSRLSAPLPVRLLWRRVGFSERLGAGTRASLPRECTPSQRGLA